MKKIFLLTLSICFIFINSAFAYKTSAALYKEGAVLAKNGEIDKAIKIFEKVIHQNPYYSLGYYGLGKAYLFKYGMNDKAIKNLRKAVALDKNFVKGHFYLGMAYYLGKKYTHAIHSFQRAYQLDKFMKNAVYNIGAIYDMMGSSYKAKIYFKKYLKIINKKDDDEINFDGI